MAELAPIITTTTLPTPNFRTRLMQWALLFSLVLHVGAALLVIFFSGFSTSGKLAPNLFIENIEFSPSLTAPSQPLPAPPAQHHTMISPSSPPPLEAEKPLQEQPAEIQQPATENTGNDGGLTSTPLGLGMTHGYFSMLADGKTLRDDIREYYSEMVEKINREWWDKAGLLKEPLHEDAVFEIVIQRDGTIIAQQLVRSTGTGEADRLLAETIRKSSPLPPLPTTYQLDQFRVPLKIKAPLSLFRMRS
ncbi:MAG: TonB C-terminal domain-containing protein [Desulfuromonadaceae bacterium]|nr:TonB C-terminal domain-containing protein [Desulfuromonadaceae bacterium]